MNKHRILVVSPNWIGDAVMAQPLLHLLKTRADVPDTAIDVLSPPTVAAVWRAVPEVANVIEAPLRSGALEWGRRRALATQLRTTGYAEAFILPNSLKSSLIPWLAGIPRRIGYKGEMRYGLLNVMHHDTDVMPRPMVSFYAALAAAPRKDAPGKTALPRPRMIVADAYRNDVLKKFTISGIDCASSIVAFAPGAEFGNAKRWPASHFAGLAQLVLSEHPAATILLLGSPKDKTICEEVLALVPHASSAPSRRKLRNLAGSTSLDEAIALTAAATVVISNDSGLLHVASALNRPVLALYGPTDPDHAPPSSDLSESIYLHLPCMPCRQRECPLGHHDCMRKISPGSVWKLLLPILKSC